MLPIRACEWADRKMAAPNRKTVFFISSIYDNVTPEMRKYLRWPLQATGYTPDVTGYLERSLRMVIEKGSGSKKTIPFHFG